MDVSSFSCSKFISLMSKVSFKGKRRRKKWKQTRKNKHLLTRGFHIEGGAIVFSVYLGKFEI